MFVLKSHQMCLKYYSENKNKQQQELAAHHSLRDHGGQTGQEMQQELQEMHQELQELQQELQELQQELHWLAPGGAAQ